MQQTGTWEIDDYYSYYDVDDMTGRYTERLIVSLTDLATGQTELLSLDNLHVTKTKITATERIDGGTVYYTLKKQ